MREKSNAATILKALEARAAKDEQLLKMLQEIDHLLSGVDNEMNSEVSDSSRSRLPYSSDPPSFEAAWS